MWIRTAWFDRKERKKEEKIRKEYINSQAVCFEKIQLSRANFFQSYSHGSKRSANHDMCSWPKQTIFCNMLFQVNLHIYYTLHHSAVKHSVWHAAKILARSITNPVTVAKLIVKFISPVRLPRWKRKWYTMSGIKRCLPTQYPFASLNFHRGKFARGKFVNLLFGSHVTRESNRSTPPPRFWECIWKNL